MGMIVGRGGTTVVSDLLTGHVLARSAGSQHPIEECRDPRAAPRGLRVAPPGVQTPAVLGRPGRVRCLGPVTVPGLSTASHRHPGHDRAVAPGLGEAALDPAHRAASVGAAPGRQEPFLGLSTHPGRTRRAGYQIGASTVWSILKRAGSILLLGATGQADGNSCADKPGAFSPPTSSALTRCYSGCTCCS